MSAEPTERKVPRLDRLAAAALCRNWHPSQSLVGLPPEAAKMVWADLKAKLAAMGEPVSCSAMFPFVRHCWRVEKLDLSDSGRWVVSSALQALAYLTSLRQVRLTACRFVGDEGLAALCGLPLHTLDISWTAVTDAGMAYVARYPHLTSLNLTGLPIGDNAVASLLGVRALQRLSLACTSITDAALDYLTYYTRYPDASKGLGLHDLSWIELSNTRITDSGVGKLVAIMDADGKPYGKVFKRLEYLALSMTNGVGPAAVRQVKLKYELDTPLPNAQRTLAKSNAVALEARDWVIRFNPTKERQLPSVSRSWEQARVLNYVAQYTKEMDAAAATTAALNRGSGDDGPKRQRTE